MSKKVLPDLIVVFNICGAGGAENVESYLRHVGNLLNQDEVNFELVISACLTSHATLRELNSKFGKRVSWSITQRCDTVNVTFNQACRAGLLHFGMPNYGFLYVDSGCDFGEDPFKLKRLLDSHVYTNGMTAALVDTDSGLEMWRPGVSEIQLFPNGTYTIPIGQTCNLHCQIFDSALVEEFGHPLPDVFRDYCTESIFSFMCAAIGKRFQMTKAARIHHEHAMDGGSSGFPGDRGWRNFLPEARCKAEDVVADPEAKLCGMGYEECEGILMHDEGLYDSDGIVQNPTRLKKFIQQNFFLPDEYYAFPPMTYLWVPHGKDLRMYDLPKEPVIPDIKEITGRNGFRAWMDKQGMGALTNVPWGSTAETAAAYNNYTLDGVFLAIEHDYRVMLETLDHWWPKIKRLGILAGYDFHHSSFKYSPAKDDPRNAIQRFCDEKHVVPHVCADGTFVILKRW